MKKLIIMALLAAGNLHAMAQDYKYLTAAYNSIEQSFELATVQKITFEGDYVVVTTSEGVTNLPLNQMEKMFFSADPTAVEALASESQGLKLVGGVLTAKGDGLLYIYDTAGRLVQMVHVDGEMRISLSSLHRGIYIVNLGNETIKIGKK